MLREHPAISSAYDLAEFLSRGVSNKEPNWRFWFFIFVAVLRFPALQAGFVVALQVSLRAPDRPQHGLHDWGLQPRRPSEQEHPQADVFPPVAVLHHLDAAAMVNCTAEDGELRHCQRRWVCAHGDAFRGDEIVRRTGQDIERERRRDEFLPRIKKSTACRRCGKFLVTRMHRVLELAQLDIAAAQAFGIVGLSVGEQRTQHAPRYHFRGPACGTARRERHKRRMKFLACDDLAEGLAPIETVVAALLADGLLRAALAVGLGLRCGGFEGCERGVEIKLVIEMLGIDDLAQARRGFAMPRPRPSDGMAGRDVGGIATDDCGRELPRAFELGDVGTTGGFLQPPMGMQLVLDLPRRRIGPYPARADNQRRKAEQMFETFEGVAGMLVEFDREHRRFE